MLHTDPEALSVLLLKAFREKKGIKIYAKISVLSEAIKLAKQKEKEEIIEHLKDSE